MAMTKKDFQEIADAMAEAKRRVTYSREDGTASQAVALKALEDATRELATACARQYKGGYGFQRQTFVRACGFEDA
jgi:hypothetical protein